MDIDGRVYCARCMREMETEGVCPLCGYQPEKGRDLSALDPGTLLNGRYQLGAVIGRGGFGITYAAWDEILGIPVAVKEYFPADFCSRNTEMSDEVIPLESKRMIYLDGLRRFQRESHLLAELQGIPNIVKVVDFFPENGTTYIAMEYIHGEPLDEWVRKKHMNASEILQLIRPVIDALVQTHQQGVLHRDLTPGNMLVCADGTIKLIDFGSAAEIERSGGTVVLTRKYAAVEQYGQEHGVQGPWTDVYGMAAVLYALLTGTEPQESVLRVYHDELVSTRKKGVKLKKEQHTALTNALTVDPTRRTQSMEEFRARLYRLPMPQEIIRHRRAIRRLSIAVAVVLLLVAVLLANFLIGLPLSRGLLLGLRGDGWHILGSTGTSDEMKLPDKVLGISVAAVDSGAFRGNGALEKVEIPGSIRHIADTAFYGCPELESVTLLDGVEDIGVAGFADCPNLAEARLPESLNALPSDTFSGSSGRFLIRGKRGSTAEVYAEENQVRFMDESEMEFEAVDGGMMLVRLESSAEDLVIPSFVDGEPVIAIADGIRIRSAVRLELPEYLQAVPAGLCEHNTRLEELRLGKETREIRKYAFNDCKNLKDFNWPEHLEEIGDSAFARCEAIREICLPEGVRSIGTYAFSFCTGLETVSLPDSLTSIGAHCFQEDGKLRKIRLSERLEMIPDFALAGTGLETLYITDSVKTIGHGALGGSAIEYLLIPDSVEKIDDRCFQNCAQLRFLEFLNDDICFGSDLENAVWLCRKDLVIGGRKESAAQKEAAAARLRFEDIDLWTREVVLDGETARAGDTDPGISVRVPWLNEAENCPIRGTSGFRQYEKLQIVTLPLFQEEIHDHEFESCFRLTSVISDHALRVIGQEGFTYCTSLRMISFAEGLESIGAGAFDHCISLERIELPDTVTSIGEGAFANCNQLTEFRIPAGIRRLDSGLEYLAAKELVIPGTVEDIEMKIFNMPNVTRIILEDGVREMEGVWNCDVLVTLVLPPSLNRLPAKALGNCSGLRHLWIYCPDMEISPEQTGLPSRTVIHGYSGSTAEAFAKEYGFSFRRIAHDFTYGDYKAE